MTWDPKFLPTMQFHDSPKSQIGNGYTRAIRICLLTMNLVEFCSDFVSDDTLLLEGLESLENELQ